MARLPASRWLSPGGTWASLQLIVALFARRTEAWCESERELPRVGARLYRLHREGATAIAATWSGWGRSGDRRPGTDARDKVIAEQAREFTRWKHRVERAEALVELQKKWRRCWGRRTSPTAPDGDGD